MTPDLDAFDHIHVFVADRAAAEGWYARVMGLHRIEALAHWAAGGGPLTLGNASGAVHLALFERTPQPCRSTVALRVGAAAFSAWRTHLAQVLPGAWTEEDHRQSRSLYFADPDGNPYEVTTYEVKALQAAG